MSNSDIRIKTIIFHNKMNRRRDIIRNQYSIDRGVIDE